MEGTSGDRRTGLGEEKEIKERGFVFVRPAPPLLA